MKQIFTLLIYFGFIFKEIDGQCTWPAPFVGSTWTDTEKGDLVFTETTMTGWTFEVDGQVRSEWRCVKADTFDEDGYLIMVTTETFVQFVTAYYYAYLCLKVKKVTDASYRYYIQGPMQRNLDNERILIFPYDSLTTVKSVCYPSIGASGAEYKLLIKAGSDMSAAIQCPYNFLGVYDYVHIASDGTETCAGGNNIWDVCSDNSMMSFNLGQCPTQVAYSGSPTVMCIDSVPVEHNNYVTVLNFQDSTVDETTTYRNSCFAISADGSIASVAPKYCRQGQTPDTIPVSDTGVPVGSIMYIPTAYTTCPTCPVPESPDGGSVFVQTDGAVTTAHYHCAETYTLYGANVRTCLGNDTWEFDMPACKCNEPTPPDNGVVAVTSDGIIATYACKAGYILNGNNQRFCQDDGKAWNGTDPSCDICDTLSDPDGGSVKVSQDGPTSKASYICNVGHTLFGVKERVCLNGGTWDLAEPICVQCPVLNSPALGMVNITTDSFTSSATFDCMTGYQLSDSKPLVCKTDGTWDSAVPECVCEQLLSPANGEVILSEDGMLATYRCDSGYTVNGHATRVCLMDGTAWNGTAPSCERCPDLQALRNGTVFVSVQDSRSVASFTCDSSYTLKGSTASMCLSDGTWDSVAPTCVQCEGLSNPSSGTVSITTNGTTSSAVYHCAQGYTLVGENTTVCLTNGSWESSPPICYCDQPSAPANGNINISTDMLVATFTCEVGYTMSGSSESFCLSDGTGWTSSQPSCVSCQTLQNSAGGTVELFSTGTVTKGNFSCDLGYTMNGVSLLSCRNDGSWDLVAPSCVLCDVPSSPPGVLYSQETNGKTTTTVFACPSGYGLSGSSTSNCRSDGSWDSSSPSCVKCEDLAIPASGSLLITSEGSYSMALFSCESGYHILGTANLSCGSSGVWSDDVPFCVCDEPSPPLHGNVTANESVAVYICDTGYTVTGPFVRLCSSDGTGWNGEEPSCVTCDAINRPENGDVTLYTDGTTTIADFTCNVGYSLRGSTSTACKPDGSWDTVNPHCVKCKNVTMPDSGLFFLITNGTVTITVFSCLSGYEIFGPPNITCSGDGSWNSAEPACVCQAPPVPPNGSVVLSQDRLTATYSCYPGFTLAGTHTRTCQPGGVSWMSTEPACVECMVPVLPSGQHATFSSDGTVSNVQFSCEKGYTMIGARSAYCLTNGQLDEQPPSCTQCPPLIPPSSGTVDVISDGITSTAIYSCAEKYVPDGNITRTCLEDGHWNGSAVVCKCDAPLSLENGNVSVSSDGLAATYECSTGFILAGIHIRICADNGTGWTQTDPSCVTCESISAPTRGTMDLSSDGSRTTATFTCDVSSSLLGNRILTCQENGTWDLAAPTCVSCPGLTDPDSGYLQSSTNGSQAISTFSCASGYYLSGNSTLYCQTTGTWSDDTPSCVCNPLLEFDNGAISLFEKGYTIKYTCDEGYSLNGTSVRHCALDGSGWSDTDPVCVTCTRPTGPDGGSVIISTDGIQTTATFVCGVGYSLKGSSSLGCLPTGTWNGSIPTCVTCPTITAPSSGVMNISFVGTSSVARYACQSNYSLAGPSERACSNSGVWDSIDPLCVCDPPLTPINSHLTKSGDGMIVSYTCDTGYSLEGVAARHCQVDGSGWDEVNPICNKCNALENINGGTIVLLTDGFRTQATYSCNNGFSMTGGAVLTCRSDGSWDMSPPSCTSCQPQTVPVGGNIALVTDGRTTLGNFTCSPGYTLNGRSMVTCKGDGTWDFVTPSCVSCDALLKPDSGTYSLSTDGTLTVANFTCVNNYHIVGSSFLRCDTTGSWNDTEPLCVCDTPDSPSHSSVESDGVLANYTCDAGYTLDGIYVRECSPLGNGWQGTEPTCNKCSKLGNLKNGNINIQTDGIASVSTFSCLAGYTLRGAETGVCYSDGTWNTPTPSCVECQTLSDPTSGNVNIQTNGTVTTAEFSCITGYEVFGSWILSCDENGFWNATEPTCICNEPAVPLNGSVTLSEDKLAVQFSCDVGLTLSGTDRQICQPEGPNWSNSPPTCVICQSQTLTKGLYTEMSTNGTVTNMTYFCASGYTMVGKPETTCQSDGTWDSQPPICVQCPDIIQPSSGITKASTNGTVSLTVTSCEDGYHLIGDAVRICNESGIWTGHDAQCLCDIPKTPTNGSRTLLAGGTTVTYTCDVGYVLIGENMRHCGEDGTGWTEEGPICSLCSQQIPPANGTINLSSDGLVSTAIFTCDSGTTLLGASVLTCQNDSTWDLPTPACVQCPPLPYLDSGNVSVVSDGQTTKALFSCSAGYIPVGAKILICLGSGQWNTSEPFCVCTPPSVPDNGQLLFSSDGFIATYTCDSGYTLKGNRERTCGFNSSGWTGINSTCVPCPLPAVPTNGNYSLFTDGWTTSAKFQCDDGFSVSGTSLLACMDSGVWTDTVPSCVQCPILAEVDSGTISLTFEDDFTVAYYGCNSGYSLSGASKRICSSNGSWANDEPRCVCKPPLSPSNGNITTYNDGMTVYYTCETGYTIHGVTRRHCQSRGAGWDEANPTCIACEKLQNLAGGTIVKSSDGTVTHAFFTCDSGYSMTGSPVLSCRSDGTWNMSQPLCTSCQSQQKPKFGDVTLTTDGYTTVASFSCLEGYSLQGAANLSCKIDGSWDFVSPSCVKCPTLDSPSSGTFVVHTDGTTTSATFSCDLGYHLNGTETISCDSNGVWTDLEPLCKCDTLPTPDNGYLELSSDRMTSVYNCDLGFTLKGVKTRVCQSDGSGWNGSDSICVLCDSIEPIENGLVNMTSDGSATTAVFTCAVGSTLHGIMSTVCGMDGQWDGISPQCEICPDVNPPSNGSVNIKTDGSITVANFACRTGFSMMEEPILSCDSNGSWSDDQPVCVECLAIEKLSSGMYILASNGTATTVSFTCDDGYYLKGFREIACLPDGTWENVSPDCVCNKPVKPVNGSVWVSADGQNAIYNCDLGFTLSGQHASVCDDGGLGWSSAPPFCAECKNLGYIDNGKVQLDSDGTTSIATFTCEKGYSLKGISVVSCQTSGFWNIPTSSTCVKCQDLPAVDSGTITVSTDGLTSIATYSCSPGYYLYGSRIRHCSENGLWNATEPVCICMPPDPPLNGNITTSGDNMTAIAGCDRGYTLLGDRLRHCQSGGSGWNGVEPSCTICATISSPAGGSMSLQSDGAVTYAIYSCYRGYSMEGTNLLTCRNDGSWNLESPSCTICQTISSPENGTLLYSSDGMNTLATIDCNIGHTLKGADTLLCLSDGHWNNSLPTCVTCPTLTAPDSGMIELLTDGLISVADYNCSNGYELQGDKTITCGTDGVWSGPEPICICIEPLPIDHGVLNLTTNNAVVKYSCHLGYTLAGNSLRVCQSDGKGWDGNTPSCVQCKTVQSPNNGTLSIQSDGESSMVHFECDIGFSISGASSASCQYDGSWDNKPPACVQCKDIISPENGSVIIQTNGTVTTAVYQCSVGYSISDKYHQPIACLSDGTWESESPFCAKCADLIVVNNGGVSLASNGSSTVATFDCLPEYFASGETRLTCGGDGMWNHQQPSCLCKAPSAILNGNVSADGNVAAYTCNQGYTMKGARTRDCRQDTSGWDGTPPVCVMCDSLPTTTEKYITSTNGSSTATRFICNIGMSIKGASTLTCNSDGNWDNSVPSCVDCIGLNNVSSGTLMFSTNSTSTSVSYECAPNYYIIGESVRICLDTGLWNGNDSRCVCNPPDAPLYGGVTISEDKIQATFHCEPGYSVNGYTSLTCLDDGSGWNREIPTCNVCETLPSPAGASVEVTFQGGVSVASYTCINGYTISGPTLLTCRSDGTWNVSAPTCVSCPTVSSLSNGIADMTTTGLVSTVHYNCNEGYALNGNKQTACKTDGTWDSQPPKCVKCPTLIAPTSGNVSQWTDGVHTFASISCNAGYYLDGDADLVCNVSGLWDSAVPTCHCEEPVQPLNGSFELTSDKRTARFVCNAGYSMQGYETLTCQSDGSGWNTAVPICKRCKQLTSVENGSSSLSSNGTTTFSVFTCEIGSSLNGSSIAECKPDGTWNTAVPVCVTCPPLESLPNGTVLLDTDGTLTRGLYSCDIGYTMKGYESTICDNSGVWVEDPPTCVHCQYVETPSSGSVELKTKGSATSATFTCTAGYDLIGSKDLTCRTDGTWDHSLPKCVCSAPYNADNGNYTTLADGMSVVYSCDVGYTMVGEATRHCGGDGKGWLGTTPTCVVCKPPLDIENGAYTQQTNGSVSSVVYDCPLGSTLNGFQTLLCKNDGDWDMPAPTCVSCAQLDDILSGSYSTSTNGTTSNVQYSCKAGYELVGNVSAQCQPDGSWNVPPPECYCLAPEAPLNGHVTSNGTAALYTCMKGYSLNGVARTPCNRDGTGWNDDTPSCVECETLPVPAGGNVLFTSDGEQTKVTFACDVGYTLDGAKTLQCSSDGNWNTQPPSCGDPCTTLTTPDNGTIVLVSDGTTTTAMIECDIGSSLKGQRNLTCRSDGSWDFSEPACASCPEVRSPSSGDLLLKTDGAITIAQFSCAENYHMKGSAVLECLDNGIWNASVPDCVCDLPAVPQSLGYDVSEDGVVVNFYCDAGLSLRGSRQITCLTDGNGFNDSVPVCVYCEEYPAIPGGSKLIQTDGTSTTMELSCDIGYSLLGAETVICNSNGQWEFSSQPSCVLCPDLTILENGIINTSTNGSVTSSRFECDIGYSMKGLASTFCRTDGKWDSEVPACVSCPAITALDNGFVVPTTNGTSTKTSFACLYGYHVKGNDSIECREDGNWNSEVPICVCNPPYQPSNSDMAISENGYRVTYSCHLGYVLHGVATRECHRNGSGWDGQDPVCATCQSPEDIVNGRRVSYTNGLSTSYYYECLVGYSLRGAQILDCQQDGSLSSAPPVCVQCPVLLPPDSGSLNLTSDGKSTIVLYSCDVGYGLKGLDIRICLENGIWNGTSPVCECDRPPSPIGGDVISDGSIAAYSCSEGYTLSGVKTRYCRPGGLSWNDTEPTCTACDTLGSVSNAVASVISDGSVTTVKYSCSVGYSLVGATVLTCRNDGTWNFDVPLCVACDTLSIPDNANVSLTTDNSTTTATYLCASGYSLKGVSVLTCRSDGTWDFTVPICVACYPLTIPHSSSLSFSTDGIATVATYACMKHYYMSGPETTKCLPTGYWETNSTTCKCVAPAKPDYGSIDIRSEGAGVSYMCDKGYSIKGPAERNCLENGLGWNGTDPSCIICDALNEVANGNISITTNGTRTSVSLECDIGSSVNGSFTVICTEDGTWEESLPTCVECPAVSRPINGDMYLSTNGTTTVALFTCALNYSLNGQQNIDCNSDGQWETGIPVCVACTEILSFDSGNVHLSTNGSMTMAHLSCSNGYYLRGESTLYCVAEGTWSSVLPICACNHTEKLENGDVVISNDKMEARYICNTGYNLVGVAIRKCQSDGAGWTSAMPTCVACMMTASPANGSVQQTSNGTVTTATFSCNIGFSLNGQHTLKCLDSGSWNSPFPVCVSCLELAVPDSGYISYQTDGENTKAFYDCTKGYSLDGLSNSVCDETGSWTSSPPTCNCSFPGNPLNGYITLSGNGSVAIYNCNLGYTINGVSKRVCQKEGLGWTEKEPFCVLCKTLVTLQGGNIELATDGYETIARFTCDPGFSMDGADTVLCRGDGTWNSSGPACRECSSLPNSAGASLTIATEGFSTKAVYVCDEGFSMVGTNSLSCSANGNWDLLPPSCVKCPELQKPSSGQVRVVSDGLVSVAVFICESGYQIHGSSNLTCQYDGSWSSLEPECICSPPPAPDQAAMVISSDGSRITFKCETGYSLKGYTELTCSNNGSGWNTHAPNCSKCEDLVQPTNGSIVLTSNGTETTATLLCNIGTSATSIGQLTCSDQGYWDSTLPSCVVCPVLVNPTNGLIQASTDGYVTVSAFTCQSGYSLKGPIELVCETDGQWSDVEPNCVKCPTLAMPYNGYFNISTNGTHTSVEFTCAEGYEIFGESTSICLASGSWSTAEPFCVCEEPKPVSNGFFNISNDKMYAIYSCLSGFSLNTVPSRPCLNDGSGWFGDEPECVKCGELENPVGGKVILTSDGTQTYANITCPSGYSVSGNSDLTCRSDGSWDMVMPDCAICDTVKSPIHGHIYFNSDGKTTTANIECEVGFTLSGPSSLQCRADGSWDFTVSSCVQCPHLVEPTNGNMTITTNAIVTTAFFSCVTGYQIFGIAHLTCDANGTWNTMEPTCVCMVPERPANGGWELSSDHMTLSYFCENGFTLKGNHIRKCYENGSGWDGADIECVKCAEISNPNGSLSVMSTNETVTQKSFSCETGSTLNGPSVISCIDDGSWSLNVPACVFCPELVPPKAGFLSVSTDGLISVATFTCYKGYRIMGIDNLTCQASGVWSVISPQCVCNEPPVPTNGSIRLSANMMTVIYSCDESFTLKGNQTRSCNDIGSGWDGSEPTCVSCETFTLTAGMSRQYISDGIHSIAIITCDTGYTISGSGSFSCNEYGEWSDVNLPTCVACPSSTPPDSGNVVIRTNGTRSTAYFTCLSGYHLQGHGEVECTDKGLWGSSDPVCQCNLPSNISNGRVISDGEVATYSCRVGYSLNGDKTRRCLPNGHGWDGTSPVCTMCINISTPMNASIKTSTNGTVTKSLFSCDLGFTLKGKGTLACQTDGFWDELLPVCVACPGLGELSSGNVSLQTTGQTSIAVFTCINGYELIGASLITCTDDGNWDASVPSCACKVAGIENGRFDLSSDHSRIQYSCDAGYTLKGPSERICLQDGTGWDQIEAECVPCDDISFGAGNIAVYSIDGLQSTAVFSCHEGSTLKGSHSLTCNASGSWVGEIPECVTCPAPNPPSSGSVLVSSNGSVSVAKYTCGVGYTLIGDNERICSTDRAWTSLEPSCVCMRPLFIPYGKIELSNNDTVATYTCDSGYSLLGSFVRQCKGDGSGWDYAAPSCVKCPTIQDFQNGQITLSVIEGQTEAMFACDTGCSLNGQFRLACRSDGAWDFQIPSCACCSTISVLSSGAVNITSNGISTSALFTCNSNYTLIGESTITCRSDGLWDKHPPYCSCKIPTTPSHGAISLSADGLSATYNCERGYSLAGNSERKCRNDGTGWEGKDPLCIKCEDIGQPKNGTLLYTNNGIKTFATVSCDQGYSLTGDWQFTCREDGNWSQTIPECLACPPTNATSGLRYNVSSDGVVTTAVFECASGFDIVGQTVLTCLRNGTWDAKQPLCLEIIPPTTTAVYCEPSDCSAGGTIGVAVALSLIIVALIVALAVLARLYRRLYKGTRGGKSLLYTSEGQQPVSQFTKHPGIEPDMTKLSLSTFDDIEIFAKAAAPISHRRHVLEMGRTKTSLAPSGHQKHLLELSSQTSTPAPWSHLTPGRSPTLSQFASHNKIESRVSSSNSSVSPKSYVASLLSPSQQSGIRGRSATPSPVPSTDGQEYESNLPQQILTPREVPIVDRVSPKPTPTANKKVTPQRPQKETSAYQKGSKRKKQPTKSQESLPSQSSQVKTSQSFKTDSEA